MKFQASSSDQSHHLLEKFLSKALVKLSML